MKKPKEKTYWGLKDPNGWVWDTIPWIRELEGEKDCIDYLERKLAHKFSVHYGPLEVAKKEGWEIVKVKIVEVK